MTTTTKPSATAVPNMSNSVGRFLAGLLAGSALTGAIVLTIASIGSGTVEESAGAAVAPPSFSIGYQEAFGARQHPPIESQFAAGYLEAFSSLVHTESIAWADGYQEAFAARKEEAAKPALETTSWVGGYQEAFDAIKSSSK